MDNDICSIPLTQAVVVTDAELEMPDQPCQSIAFLAPLKILFLSKYGSRPGEINPTTLRAHGHTVVEPNLPDNNFARSVTLAQRVFNRHQPDVVVGWSRCSPDLRGERLLSRSLQARSHQKKTFNRTRHQDWPTSPLLQFAEICGDAPADVCKDTSDGFWSPPVFGKIKDLRR